MLPNADEFSRTLRSMLDSAGNLGLIAADVRAGDLHRRVGGYPGADHRMPLCCGAMRQAMKVGDEVVRGPASGQGASLVVRYRLPR
jgi:hypothetical protein